MNAVDKIISLYWENISSLIFIYLISNFITIVMYLLITKFSNKIKKRINENEKEIKEENCTDKDVEDLKMEIVNFLKKEDQKSVYKAYTFIVILIFFIVTIVLHSLNIIPDKIMFSISGIFIFFSMYTSIDFFEFIKKKIIK